MSTPVTMPNGQPWADDAIIADIGVNLASRRFGRNHAEILERAYEAWVGHVISISNSLKECRENLKLCETFAPVYNVRCTIGIHPHNAKEMTSTSMRDLKALISANANHVVAVGECGLDYDRLFSPALVQQECFEAQIKLALDVGLPLYFHERDAHEDFCRVVGRFDLRDRAVVHCFTGSRAVLLKYLEFGFFIGITGWVCDERRGAALRQIIPLIPLDKLLLETDAPYLTPGGIRPKPSLNEPAHIIHVVNTVASLRRMDAQELARVTTANAKRFFKLS